MLVLVLRTDKPEAELGLYRDGARLAFMQWQAHRQLGATIHSKLREALRQAGCRLEAIQGIVAYHGPGSFTGLRIGLTVANTLATELDIPVVGVGGDDWLEQGLAAVATVPRAVPAMPQYGGEAHITLPKGA